MAATFTRVNGVLADTFTAKTRGLYPDASLAAGQANASSVVPITGPTATYGQLWRGMPVGILPTTGKLVPMNASGAVYAGVLIDDLTAYVLARGTKVAYATSGRVRSYAGGNLTVGDPVKADTSANFSGFVKWVAGTDAVDLRVGHAFPLDDGSASNGSTAAVSMVQGDSIFVELI